MRIGGRLRGSTCVLRPDLGGRSNHHHPDYWIFRLVGAAILCLRFSASMETGPLSDTWAAVWCPPIYWWAFVIDVLFYAALECGLLLVYARYRARYRPH